MSLVLRFVARSPAAAASSSAAAVYRAATRKVARCRALNALQSCQQHTKSTAAAKDKRSAEATAPAIEHSSHARGRAEGSNATLESLGIDKEIARALKELHGVQAATTMQASIIQELVAPKRHVVVRQETGAGKTLMLLATLVSQALDDYHRLLSKGTYRPPDIFAALAVSTIVVVPNRELALQLESWAHALVRHAYPHLSPAKFVQRFVVLSTSKENDVSKAEAQKSMNTSHRELRVLARHGPPAIAVGTHRRLLEMFRDPSNSLVVLPPRLMRDMYPTIAASESTGGEELIRSVQNRKHELQRSSPDDLSSYVGLRRLLVDEVDSTLAVDSTKWVSASQRRRAPKPRAGQVLVKSILEVCGNTPMLARIMDTHSQQVMYSSDDTATCGTNVYARTLATSIGPTEAHDLSISGPTAKRNTRRLSEIFAGVSDAITKTLGTREDQLSGGPPDPQATTAEPHQQHPVQSSVKMSDPELNAVSPVSLQVVVAAATPTRRVRTWLRNNGCVPGDTTWLQSSSSAAGEEGGGHQMPRAIRHHCIIIEDESQVRNLRLKEKKIEGEPVADQPKKWYEHLRKTNAESYRRHEDKPQQPPPPLAGLIAEVAANVIEHCRGGGGGEEGEGGPVLIFTHPSADKSGLAKALRPYGIEAHDILRHFEPGTPHSTEHRAQPVYLVSEPAARGLDLPDASLVLILDTPSSATSYLHMAGRTGRFGRPGQTVTVMPMGMHGFFESKMRGIYSVLNIVPEKLSVVED
ncbi:hypothetical protein EV179_003051 [Coemansia sp. RSA 487]|nr:hypothetical protein EV179_003051 [Coemansia sp. RSA 487]